MLTQVNKDRMQKVKQFKYEKKQVERDILAKCKYKNFNNIDLKVQMSKCKVVCIVYILKSDMHFNEDQYVCAQNCLYHA